jgi:hypothetical protein
MDLNKNIKGILSIVVLSFVFVYFFFCLIAGVKPDPQITIANVGALGTVLGYWFGSSSGSAKKDDTIASQAANPVVNSADTVNVKS